MKNLIPLVAAVVISLGIGIVIGRKTNPEGSTGGSANQTAVAPSEYRSSRMNGSSGSSRHGKGAGSGSTSDRVDNKVKHMTRLAEKLNMERGMPDFDALFGIWETASSMEPKEIKLALEEMKSLKLPQQSKVFMQAMLVMQWAKKDGHAAMAFAIEQKRGRDFFPMKEMALQAWGSIDPTGAYNWYESNKETLNPRERKQFEAQAIAALAKNNFDLAFQKAKNVSSASRAQVLTNLGSVVATNKEQRDQLVQYLTTVEDKEIRDNTGRSIAMQLATANTQEAIQFVKDWPGEDKSALSQMVAIQWGKNEPEQAMQWRLDQLQEGKDRTDTVDDIFGDWARRTPEAAQSWLDKQDDLDKDKLLGKAINRMRWDEDYEQSIAWANQIDDASKRNQNYKTIYSSWSSSDKEGAQRWLDSQPEDIKAAVKGSSNKSLEHIESTHSHEE